MSETISPKTLDPNYADTVAALTRAVRSADITHEKVGGSSRHYVVDCLLPSLADEGLVVLPTAKVTVISDGDEAALREQVATLAAVIRIHAPQVDMDEVRRAEKPIIDRQRATIATLTLRVERLTAHAKAAEEGAAVAIATLEAEREALTKNVDHLVAELKDVGYDYPDSNVARFIVHDRTASAGDWYDPATRQIMFMDAAKAFALRADVERLTNALREDNLRLAAVREAAHKGPHRTGDTVTDIEALVTDNARHLETIRALRSFISDTQHAVAAGLDVHYEDFDKPLTTIRDALNGYKQADDMCTHDVCTHCEERTKPFLDVATGLWCCDRCLYSGPKKADDVKGGG